MNDMYFKDKVIWITGASSGIGEGLVYALAREGARLIISSRKQPELERVKNNCPEGSQVMVLPLDVADFEALPGAAEKVLAEFGQIDILINNAGISQRELIIDTDLSTDRKLMDVNYFGTIALTKAVLPQMLQQKSGQIVVMSSVLGKMGVPWRSGYCASKHALHGYFDSLRAEVFKHNIKVSVICPGYVKTNVTINALKGDGSKNAVMAESTAGGWEPSEFAPKVLNVIKKQKREVYLGKKEVIGVYLNRYLPAVWAKIARGLKLK
jgi:short-subunit dehydrogenase